MNSVAQVAQVLEKILQEEIEEVGRAVGFLKRLREISSADFVQTLIFAWLQEPEISLDGLTQVAERREVSVSASALSQRFGPEAAEVLAWVLQRLCAQQRPRRGGRTSIAAAVQCRGGAGQFQHRAAPRTG